MELDNFLKVTEARIKTEYGLDVRVVIMPIDAPARMKPAEMCRTIGRALGLSEEATLSTARTTELVIYRQLCCYMIREYYSYMSLKQIGFLIGGYDHTTVISSINRVKAYLEKNDPLMKDRYIKAMNAVAAWTGEQYYYN